MLSKEIKNLQNEQLSTVESRQILELLYYEKKELTQNIQKHEK
jgi:hypothetical protein